MSSSTRSGAGVRAYLPVCTAARNRVAARRRGGRSMASNEDAPRGKRGEARRAAREADRRGRVAGLGTTGGRRARVRGTVPVAVVQQHDADLGAARSRVRGGPAVPNPSLTLVAGYRQWQGLGRQVMKGQPGYMIFAPVTGRFARDLPMPDRGVDSGRGRSRRPTRWCARRMVGARTGLRVGHLPDRRRTAAGAARRRCWKAKYRRAVGRAGRADSRRGFEVLRVPHEGMIPARTA